MASPNAAYSVCLRIEVDDRPGALGDRVLHRRRPVGGRLAAVGDGMVNRPGVAARFFGVAADPLAYTSLLYLLLSLATGIFYFTWVAAGVSLSAGLSVLIVGIPFLILYFGSVRVLSLVEGRIVEVMLGERMPRRPLYADRGKPWLERIKSMFTDPRTWTTQLYFLLMLPLGVFYVTRERLAPGYLEAAMLVPRLEVPQKLDRSEGDIHEASNTRVAWLKDPDGNILGLVDQ